MSPRALVTGSTGFIGGTLARRLAEDGWEVHCVVRPSSDQEVVAELGRACRLHIHEGSTEQLVSVMREADPDIVFHLASRFLAEHEPEHVADLIGSNVLFSAQLVEAMTHCGCKRLVNTGTSWQHYQTTGYRPVNLYAATKQASEDILAYYHDAHDLSVLTLKLFDTYGPMDRRRKLINVLIDAAMSGERLDMSPGEQIVDLTHVDDVASAFLTASRLLRESSQPLQGQFFVSGERYSVRELVGVVEHATGRTLDVSFGVRPYRSREVMMPECAGPRLPGWKIRVSLSQGLRQVVKSNG